MEKKPACIVIAALLLFVVILTVCAYTSHAVYSAGSPTMAARRAVLGALGGVYSLSLSADFGGVRNLTEGAYGCLSDIPGGYSFIQGCDVVALPKVLQAPLYTVRLIRGAERQP